MNPRKFNRLLKNIKYDKNALEEIYNEYYPQIVLHLRRRFGDLISPEDLAQEVFVALLQTEDFREVEYPTTWIYRLADNKAIDKIRTRHAEAELNENIADEFFIDDLISKEDVRAVLKKLDRETQFIIYLHVWEGYSYQEIAEMTNLSCINVRVKVSRAYSLLKKFM